MNQSHANVAGGFAGRADCQAANGQIGYQNIKTVTLDASNEGVRYTPAGAPSIDNNTINPIAICAIPIRARGQFGTQNTPQTAQWRVTWAGEVRLDRQDGALCCKFNSGLRSIHIGKTPKLSQVHAANDGYWRIQA